MRVGTSWEDITPDRKITIAGQMNVRLGEYTRDSLTVNAVVFEDLGNMVAIVSCDICVIPDDVMLDMTRDCSEKTGIPAENIIIAATHTHVAPNTTEEIPGKVEQQFMQDFKNKVSKSVQDSIANLEEADIYAGSGFVEQMGFNRRGMHDTNRCDMYFGSWNKGFEGLEGPRDGQVPVIFAKRADGSVKVVVSSFATHPNSVEGESYYSADVPGAVRVHIRKVLGEDVGVVYLTGAAGNTAPSQMENNPENIQPWRGEDGLRRSGMYLGSEIVKTIAVAADPMPNPKLVFQKETIKIPIMDYPENSNIEWDNEHFHKARLDWDRKKREDSPYDVRINVVRVGDAAICTNPAELYVEFGLQIKEKSPAQVTLVSELTDGYVGYVATPEAYRHGGYSTWPAETCKLAHDAGEQIVSATEKLLNRAFSS